MRALILAALLALTALSLCQGAGTNSRGAPQSRPSAAFMSRRDSANALNKKQKTNAAPNRNANAAKAALEPQREVCELNPGCDELADQIGFVEAYRRFYGPV